MGKKLWELRLKVIDAYEKLVVYKAIKSTEAKISGYTDRGILMSPEAMHNTITLLEKARETNQAIIGYGRSKLKKTKDISEEEKKEKDSENILNKFNRSVCTTNNDNALERVKNIEKQKKYKGKNFEEIAFIKAMQELEKYMFKNNINHSFKCKNEKLGEDDINDMIEDAENLDLDLDQHQEKIKVLRNIKKMKDQSLFDFCDKKPYQCLLCPFYYEDFKEFTEMKIKKKKSEVCDQ